MLVGRRFQVEQVMPTSRHPSRDDVVIQHSHRQFTVAHGSPRDEIKCSTFEEALDRAERYANADRVNVWYRQGGRKTMTLLDEPLVRRVWSEFREQPGLSLTLAQAQRLWALDEGTCARLLNTLSEAKLLFRDDTGRYRLPSTESASRRAGARMARLGLRPVQGAPAASLSKTSNH
jgi:hypothetical protein